MGIPDHPTCLLQNMYAGQEATVRTKHKTIEWFQTGKKVCEGCILLPCLFNLYAEYINAKCWAGWITSWMKFFWSEFKIKWGHMPLMTSIIRPMGARALVYRILTSHKTRYLIHFCNLIASPTVGRILHLAGWELFEGRERILFLLGTGPWYFTQPSHPLSPPFPPALKLFQHQGLFQWVSSSNLVAKLLEFQLQHQSFQWIFRVAG